MEGVIKRTKLSDIFQIESAKSYVLPVLASGRVKSTLYVPSKFEMGHDFACFTSKQNDSGYYLVSEHRSELIYCSFILNGGIGMLYLKDKDSIEATKGTVTKKKLGEVMINQIPERYIRACNILELIITRVGKLKVDDQVVVAKEATVSFLKDMRSYISLEIYMNSIFESRQVSVLEPWTRFVEEKAGSYKIDLVDDVFVSFYKSVTDPDNAIMDAMKKAKLFVWELGEAMKTMKP